jgi:hypothetical protein
MLLTSIARSHFNIHAGFLIFTLSQVTDARAAIDE